MYMTYPLPPTDKPVTHRFKRGTWYKCVSPGCDSFRLGFVYLCVTFGDKLCMVTDNHCCHQVVNLSARFIEADPC